jgi:hypothetical protein
LPAEERILDNINGDGRVDDRDLTMIARNFGKKPAPLDLEIRMNIRGR